jgi:hypothetical protein
VASPPASNDRLRSRRRTAACAAPGPYPPDLSRCEGYGASGTGSSRTASRLACRTHAAWKYRRVPSLSGLLPPHRTPLRIGCPQLHQPAATGQRRGSLTPTRSNGSASWRTSMSSQITAAYRGSGAAASASVTALMQAATNAEHGHGCGSRPASAGPSARSQGFAPRKTGAVQNPG